LNVPGQKDKFTPELRILVASLLSIVVILVWGKYYGPKPPIPPARANRPTPMAPATPGPSTTGPSERKPSEGAPAQAAVAAAPANVPQVRDSEERTITIENTLYRVEISNKGAVVKSWELKKYRDDTRPPQRCRDGSNAPCVLDLVHQDAAQQTGGWPFAVVLDDDQLESAANGGLYRVRVEEPGSGAEKQPENNTVPGNQLSAPADLQFVWSDGHLEVTKHFRFDHSYVVRVETSARLNGSPIKAGLGWLGGFGDLTVRNPTPVTTVSTYYSEGGRITSYPHKKLEEIEKWGPGVWQGGKDFVGIQDTFFTAAFLPPNGAAPGTLETRFWKAWRNVRVGEQDTPEPVPEVAVASFPTTLALRVYVGPKDYDDLKRMNPPLQGLVNFGWLAFIAEPLFHALKWLHNYIPNWGWAIVVLTLILNMLLLPLRISGYKTTLKMQRVAPQIKAIQEKYKKYSMRDPRKADMNKEVMAIYSREGINPMGGCIPQLLQFPIWFGLYRALQGTIELRHAPWFGWITDLSAKDPYYILPLLMGLSMYWASKMTPMTATDPQQQAMMKIMPIGMAAMFMVIPYPSGLAVYILTSSVVGIAQQWYLNRTHPLPAPGKPPRVKNGKKS
jgi:YidC/Oxa1 family membrane protein insertase